MFFSATNAIDRAYIFNDLKPSYFLVIKRKEIYRIRRLYILPFGCDLQELRKQSILKFKFSILLAITIKK